MRNIRCLKTTSNTLSGCHPNREPPKPWVKFTLSSFQVSWRDIAGIAYKQWHATYNHPAEYYCRCLRKNKKLHRYINFNPPFCWYFDALDLCPLIHKILSNVSWEQEWQPMVLNCSCRSSGPNWTFPVLYVKWIFCFIDKFTLQSQRLSSKKLQVF